MKTSMVAFLTGAQEQCLKDRFTHRRNAIARPQTQRKFFSRFFGTINTFYYYSRPVKLQIFARLTCRRSVVAAMQDTSFNAQVSRRGSNHSKSHTIPRSDKKDTSSFDPCVKPPELCRPLATGARLPINFFLNVVCPKWRSWLWPAQSLARRFKPPRKRSGGEMERGGKGK